MKVVKCPSCGKEVLAGKYCIECSAELTTDRTSVMSEEFLGKMEERIAKRVISEMKAESQKAAEEAAKQKPESQGGKSGKFFKQQE